MRSQIEIAIAAALSVDLPLYWMFTRRDSLGRPNPLTSGEAAVLLLVLACYLSVPYMVGSFRRRRVLRAVPLWFWVSVLGAALILTADYSIGIRYGLSTWEGVGKDWFALTVFTLPVTALVYYSGAIVGLIKEWHFDRRDNLRIVRR
ncbi:MAG TPA: hypothetical protein VGB76_11210 [Pyrinomonadaceae bacterium]|jgi:hypothetical protein